MGSVDQNGFKLIGRQRGVQLTDVSIVISFNQIIVVIIRRAVYLC